jgi:hypothetical protein
MDNDKVKNLNKERALRSGDAAQWSVVDALKHTLELIESGGMITPDKVVVCLSVPLGDGEYYYPSLSAGVNNLEACGLLAIILSESTKPNM